MFFSKIAASIALAAPLVSALTITTPTNWTSTGPAVITWSAVNGDPQTFSIELINNVFNRQFALANNVATGAMTLSLTLPSVPEGDGYNLQFVNIGNLTDVFAQTGDFAIGAAVSSSTTSTSASASGSGTTVANATVTPQSSSGFGTTVSNTGSGASGATGSVTGSGAVGSTTPFNNGAAALGLSHKDLVSFAVMAGAALAGARLVGF
ncbi:uncharacterized protein FOMMEDRAFT_149034 [Fomitiporia mediterranea MF3/22]|uniref:uncharacterized protein n=1 Tax=Fomitiporia mediterranea (strain MF3/22) TaxID=694068 RepID=UPI0004408AC7|nr:uncharacterized protein FOMMEDRAFT_149034 [Fomitiporia mediterranea MF3/22]EJC98637.1 hypothetical protein FOMMEDRAFT_149034 [Fomitiporia mediterranea MF3/22]